MKCHHGLLIFALTVVLALTSPGVLAGGAIHPGTGAFGNHSIYLNALKPDLEYLRGYWLKNPGEKSREGRILFPNNGQISVQFERAANAINDDAWDGDYLKLKDIYELYNQPTSVHRSNSTQDELFYKLATFYARKNPRALPESVEDVLTIFIRTQPVKTGRNKKPSIEIRYIDLNTLGTEIEREVSRIDSQSAEESTVVTVNICENQFSFDYVKDRMQLYVGHVRIITFGRRYVPVRVPGSMYMYRPHEADMVTGHFVESNEYSFIRYDRVTKMFYSSKNVMLDEMSIVRSSVRNYILKDNTSSAAGCVVPSGSDLNGNMTSTP